MTHMKVFKESKNQYDPRGFSLISWNIQISVKLNHFSVGHFTFLLLIYVLGWEKPYMTTAILQNKNPHCLLCLFNHAEMIFIPWPIHHLYPWKPSAFSVCKLLMSVHFSHSCFSLQGQNQHLLHSMLLCHGHICVCNYNSDKSLKRISNK